MEVYKSKFWTINFLEDIKTLNPIWFPISYELTDSDYKSEMETYTETVEKYKPQAALIDCLNFAYAIPPAIQEWTNEVLFPRILSAGVRKVAILLPAEIITQLSLEQVMGEALGLKFQTNYFSNYEQALKWINS